MQVMTLSGCPCDVQISCNSFAGSFISRLGPGCLSESTSSVAAVINYMSRLPLHSYLDFKSPRAP